MNMTEKIVIIKTFNELSNYYINKGICDMVDEHELFMEIYEKTENMIKLNQIIEDDFKYLVIKFYGSETYYIDSINRGVDKREALMTKIRHNIYDDDCYEISTHGSDGKTRIISRRNDEGKWVTLNVIK